jgi:hypothetical protein
MNDAHHMLPIPDKEGLHPSGEVISFYEADHRYCLHSEPEREFVSATTWISQFFPVFDRELVSARYAARNGLTQESVLAAWDEKSRIARERGTWVHACAERLIRHYLNCGELLTLEDLHTLKPDDGESPDPELTRALIASMHEAVGRMGHVLDFIDTERIIASPGLGLAGMVDLTVQLRTQSGKRVIGLYDWKTNAKIEKHNAFQRALPPIEHLTDCNFTHYSLQLNLYEYICRTEGYFPPDTQYQKVLIHLGSRGYETHKCPDMQPLIADMLRAVGLDGVPGADLQASQKS